MKVELLVNLKIKSGQIISAGTIFADDNGPIPDFIMRRIGRKMAKVLPDNKKVEAPLPVSPGGASSPQIAGEIAKKEVTFKERIVKEESPVSENKTSSSKDKKKAVVKEKKVLLKKEKSPEE